MNLLQIILPTSPPFDFQTACSDSQYFSKHQIVLGSSSFIKAKQVKHRRLDISHAAVKHELYINFYKAEHPNTSVHILGLYFHAEKYFCDT